ncbi:arylsulfatase [Luteolibacter algae]|uniref:Arylsulfatase n=1 Tax=Luteolibacter algae TaxID=454151 RepID=A0ABW5DCI5_9BACT
MKHHFLISALVALSTSAFTLAGEKPNILIIYGDDIGYGDFSCYGATGVQTPNIDALAKNGIRFRSAYATAATCTPSRYSLLTGEYAFRNEEAHILPGNAPLIINPERPTVATFLRDNGYSTALVGKWHLGLGSVSEPLDWNGLISPGPKEVGFDYSFNMAATADRVPSVYIENGHIVGLDPADPVKVNYAEKVGDEPTGISHPQLLKVQADEQHSGTIVNGVSRIGWMTGGHAARFKDEDMADTYLNKAIEFISGTKEQPFFLYYAPNENHVPRVIHPRFQGSTNMGPRGDALAAFDWCVGRLVQELKAQDKFDNTLIILSSDNGPVLFDGYWDGAVELNGDHRPAGPWNGGKYSRWEGGTRVPFIVSWPKMAKPGVSDALVSHVDIFASIAGLIGKPLPDKSGADGENLIKALTGESAIGREFIVQQALAQIAIRKGDWKYVPPGSVTQRGGIDQWIETQVDAPGLLFNLGEDPEETTNLAADYPEIVADMQGIIEKVAPEKSSGDKKINKKQLGF